MTLENADKKTTTTENRKENSGRTEHAEPVSGIKTNVCVDPVSESRFTERVDPVSDSHFTEVSDSHFTERVDPVSRTLQNRRSTARKQALKKLEKDKNLNNEERLSKLKDFDEKGYFTYPVTSVMDKKKNIIEFKKEAKVKTDEELMDELDLSHLEGQEKEMMRKVFKDNIKVFSRSEMDIPVCDLVEARPELTEEAKSEGVQNCKFREISASIRDQVEDVLSSMVKAGILKFSNKPTHIVSNLLCARKKDGSPRLCLDARIRNSSLKKIPFQLESMESVFQKFNGCTYASLVDLSNSYYSCKIQDSKQPIFSFFNSKRQMLSFARLPMGFVNSEYYLAQITDKIKEKNHNCVSYVDDLYLVTYSDFKDHRNQLRNLLSTLIDFNLRVKAKKCSPASECLDVLGHCWTRDRFNVPAAKLQGIMDWESPKTFKGIAKYTGHIGLYRRYTPGLAECLIPLQELSSEGIEFKRKGKQQG